MTSQITSAAIAKRDGPSEIEGRQALFVINLPVKAMAGQLSQGMLLDIGYSVDDDV